MELDIHRAMINSYRVIIQQQEPEDIISTDLGIFAHDPSTPLERDVIEGILEYFEIEEEYEKCAQIKKFIKERW